MTHRTIVGGSKTASITRSEARKAARSVKVARGRPTSTPKSAKVTFKRARSSRSWERFLGYFGSPDGAQNNGTRSSPKKKASGHVKKKAAVKKKTPRKRSTYAR